MTFGFDDVPPCVNSEAIADGFALYAARNVDWSNLKVPFWSSVTPARFGLPRLEPATASSIAVASRFASWVVAKSPVSGCAVFVVGSYAVTEAIVWCSALAASTSACTLSARPCASCAVDTVTGPELAGEADEREGRARQQARHHVRRRRHGERAGAGADRELRVGGGRDRDETAGARVEVGAGDVEVVQRAGRGRSELEAELVGADLHRAREHARRWPS